MKVFVKITEGDLTTVKGFLVGETEDSITYIPKGRLVIRGYGTFDNVFFDSRGFMRSKKGNNQVPILVEKDLVYLQTRLGGKITSMEMLIHGMAHYYLYFRNYVSRA